MRTSVAPSSTATSKSPDMPMDSSRIVTPGIVRACTCAQHFHLRQGLLDAVLAEHPAPAGRRLAQALDGDRLRHGHQGDATGIAPGPSRRSLDASSHCIQPALEVVAHPRTRRVLFYATAAGLSGQHDGEPDPAAHAAGPGAIAAIRVEEVGMAGRAETPGFDPSRADADLLQLTAVEPAQVKVGLRPLHVLHDLGPVRKASLHRPQDGPVDLVATD